MSEPTVSLLPGMEVFVRNGEAFTKHRGPKG